MSNLRNAKRERVICEKRMRNWRAKLGKLRNAKCENTVCVNEQQSEDMNDRTSVYIVAPFLVVRSS